MHNFFKIEPGAYWLKKGGILRKARGSSIGKYRT